MFLREFGDRLRDSRIKCAYAALGRDGGQVSEDADFFLSALQGVK